MNRTHSIRVELALLSALTVAFSGLMAGTIWASPPPAEDTIRDGLEASVVSRHRGPIVIQVWAGAKLHRLGTVPPNAQRTFELPTIIAPGVAYQLVSDCPNGHRIVSEPIVASADVRPQFVVSLSQESSFLRYDGH